MSNDFIPRPDAKFDVWGNNLCAIAVRNTMGEKPKWPHIPTAAVEKMVLAFKVWHEAYLLTLQPHPPALTVAKDEARAAAEAVIRPFVGQWLMWDPVTDEQREEAGVHNKQPRRSAIPAPSTVPLLEPRAGTPRQILVPYHDKGSMHRGKPEDVHGIEVRWALLDHAPFDIETDLTNSAFDTKSPLIMNFMEHERGQRIYLAGRWEIEREGIKGNFGDIESVIIP